MHWRNAAGRYGGVAKTLHWGMALLILGMLAVGIYMVDLPGTPDKFTLYGWHKSFGATILVLAFLRFCWRLTNPQPALPEHMKPLERLLAHLSHYALYGFMFLLPMSGWLMSSAAGFPVSVFGWFTLPDLIAPEKATRELFGLVHQYAAYLLIGLLVLHVAASLLHHFYHKDDVLRRMLPGK